MSDEVASGHLIPYLSEMFRYQAWVALGKLASPVSGKVERELGVARTMIDLLSELETKTEGNRSRDETRLLQATLTDLRLNYVDEMKKGETPAEAPSGGAAAGASPPETTDTP